MIAFIAVVFAVLAFVRVTRVERELRLLRQRLSLLETAPEPAGVPARDEPAPPIARPATGVEPGPRAPAVGATPVPPRPPVQRPHVIHAPVPPSPPLPPPRVAAAAGESQDLEHRIGGRLLLYAGMIVLVLGVAFFLKYAFEHEWISPVVRVLAGGATGLAFIVAGRRLAVAGFRPYGLFLSGGGLAILFLSVYASFAFYALIEQGPAFVLLALVAVAAALIAARESSQALALMAVCGGFATPFLVGRGGDAQLLLFSYDAVLVGATIYLAHVRGWPWLNLASFVLTVFTVVAWAAEYYTSAKYLRTEIFLTIFCAQFLGVLRANRRSTDADAQIVSAILWLAPVMYHAGSLAVLHPHDPAFFVYLLLAAVAILVVSIEASAPPVRLVGWAAVVAPLVLWLQAYGPAEGRTAAIVTGAGIWLVFLANHVRMARAVEWFGGWDVALLHLSGLGAFATIYAAIIDTATPRDHAFAAAGFAAANALLWAAFRRRSVAALHWLGLAFSLAAVAVALRYSGQWAPVMWAMEAAVLVWIGVRLDRDAFRFAGLLLFAVAIWRWLVLGAQPLEGPFVVLLNARALAGLAIVMLLYVAGWLMRGARALPEWRLERAIVLVGAAVMTALLVSLEIGSYWAQQDRDASARLAMHMMLSAWWALYAGTLVAIGMWRHYAPVRYFAILLFAATLGKVFIVDIQQLAGIYRVIGFLLVGAILLVASFLYQRSQREQREVSEVSE